jgi:hypothetical protein
MSLLVSNLPLAPTQLFSTGCSSLKRIGTTHGISVVQFEMVLPAVLSALYSKMVPLKGVSMISNWHTSGEHGVTTVQSGCAFGAALAGC